MTRLRFPQNSRAASLHACEAARLCILHYCVSVALDRYACSCRSIAALRSGCDSLVVVFWLIDGGLFLRFWIAYAHQDWIQGSIHLRPQTSSLKSCYLSRARRGYLASQLLGYVCCTLHVRHETDCRLWLAGPCYSLATKMRFYDGHFLDHSLITLFSDRRSVRPPPVLRPANDNWPDIERRY
jgi:hypothetical protein